MNAKAACPEDMYNERKGSMPFGHAIMDAEEHRRHGYKPNIT